MIRVTKSFLPPIKEYQSILQKIWSSNWLTNRGNLVLDLEERIKSYLGVGGIIAMANGTLPLQIAIKSLGLKGEIITTPYSYIATLSSLVWENCKPVFVDIHPDYWTIDEDKIEAAITSQTSGILATHVYGNPCEVDKIEKIAIKHNLKVIYDAAHAFGVNYKGQSIFNRGDISTCSFHATKIFHTGEGGALFSKNNQILESAFSHHNFGHKGVEDFGGLGINAKMSELQAAMGLAVLPYFSEILQDRKRVCDKYLSLLESSKLKFIKVRNGTNWNYSYFPLVFESEKITLKVKFLLERKGVYPRRYFFPALNTLPYVEKQSMPIAESVSRCVLCLPNFYELPDFKIVEICEIINEVLC